MVSKFRALKVATALRTVDLLIRYTPLFAHKDAPPNVLNLAGGGDFTTVGDANIAALVSLADLSAGDDTLEIGCGIARNAFALHRKFGDSVTYAGFDVMKFCISWSNKYFGADKPNYSFRYSNMTNSMYNPSGEITPSEYDFEYPDASFDLVFATSVFTHMQEPDFYHFVNEALRVLRPNGRFYFTAFLWDDDAERATKSGEAAFSFKHQAQDSRLDNREVPDAAVAHSRSKLLAHLDTLGGQPPLIINGGWRRKINKQFQDCVLIRKAQ
jgi:SAM-dependent methyltransferase